MIDLKIGSLFMISSSDLPLYDKHGNEIESDIGLVIKFKNKYEFIGLWAHYGIAQQRIDELTNFNFLLIKK